MTELNEKLTTGDRVRAVLGTLKSNDTIHYDLVEDRPIHEVLADAWRTGQVQRVEDLVFVPETRK